CYKDATKLKLKLLMKSVAAAGSNPLTPQVVSAAKLPILNPNEFDLWKMRIEQYFLMTDYFLWEVILNGDSPVSTRIVKGVSQLVAPTTTEQRLARKNELKACGTLLIALLQKLVSQLEIHGVSLSQEDVNLKFLHSLPSEWKTHILTWRNKVDLEERNLNDLFNSLKIYETEVKQSSFSSITTQNLAFVSSTSTDSTTDSVSTAGSVSTACVKLSASLLPNDQRRPGTAEPQRRTVPRGLESVEARLLVYKQNESIFEENIKPLNIEVQLRDTVLVTHRQKLEKAEQERDDLKLKLETFQTSSKNLTALLASQTSEKAGFIPSGGYHTLPPSYTGTFMPSKLDLVFNTGPIPVEIDYLAFNVQLSPTKHEQALSHTFRPSEPIIKDWVYDSEEESKPKDSQQSVPSFAQSSMHVKNPRHSVQPIETTFQAATHVPACPMSNSSGKRRNKKGCFVLLTQSKPVSNPVVRPVSAVLPYIPVTRPRHANQVSMVSAAKGKQGTWVWRPKCLILDHDFRTTTASMTLKRFDYNDALGRSNGCTRNMTGNMSYLSDFEELNEGYVAFGGNPKGGKIIGKGKIKTGKLDFYNVYFVKELKFDLFSVSQMCDKKNYVLFTDTECLVLSSDFKLPDESQVLLRVPRETNMYNVNLKNIVPSGDLTCLFAKATLDESNLWHRRLAHVNFKTLNKLVKGNLVRGLPTKVFENDHTSVACKKGKQHRASCKTKPYNAEDTAFDGKEHDFDVQMTKSKAILSSSSSAKSNNQDDMTMKDDKGKSPIEFVTGYRDLNVEFQDCFKNSKADFNNLESSIPVSRIPTTRIHKDHPISQVIGDLSSTTQTKSMIRVVKDRGRLSQMFGNDFHTCMFACFLSQEEPKRVHQALKDPSWIEAMNKKDEIGIVIWIKARLIAQRHTQEEGIDYEEDLDHPNKVYKVVKALYGLHQAPSAWYETLATYPLKNGFQRGTIDQPLFIKKKKGHILLVQIYVDDIIFGAINRDLCRSFEKLMKDKF
nr:putative ribonuclease H-like domain-containing protein [Tanacetum cinerariifolium]